MDIVIRAAVAFLFILLVTRAIGRRELSGLEPFDLIMLVVLGDLIQQGVTQSDYSITGALVVVATMGALTVGMAWISYRFRRVRPERSGTCRGRSVGGVLPYSEGSRLIVKGASGRLLPARCSTTATSWSLARS